MELDGVQKAVQEVPAEAVVTEVLRLMADQMVAMEREDLATTRIGELDKELQLEHSENQVETCLLAVAVEFFIPVGFILALVVLAAGEMQELRMEHKERTEQAVVAGRPLLIRLLRQQLGMVEVVP